MSTLSRTITNNRTTNLSIFVPGIDPNNPVVIAPSASLDLLTVMSVDSLFAIQSQLAELVASGSVSVTATLTSSAARLLDLGNV